MNFDGNALYMHSDVVEMRDLDEDPAEVEADAYNLNYIKLDGEVGCMVNGAGLAWRLWISLNRWVVRRLTSWMSAAALT